MISSYIQVYISGLWSPPRLSCQSHKNGTASEGKNVSNFRPLQVACKGMQWTGRLSNRRVSRTTTPALYLSTIASIQSPTKITMEKLQFTSGIPLRCLREPRPTSRLQRVYSLGPPRAAIILSSTPPCVWWNLAPNPGRSPAGDPVGPTIFWVYADIIRGSRSNVQVPQHDGVTYGSPLPPLLC